MLIVTQKSKCIWLELKLLVFFFFSLSCFEFGEVRQGLEPAAWREDPFFLLSLFLFFLELSSSPIGQLTLERALFKVPVLIFNLHNNSIG